MAVITSPSLSDIVRYYHTYHATFVEIADAYPLPEEEKLRAYRRTLIALYEATRLTGQTTLPFSVEDFIREAAPFFLTHYNPQHLAVDIPWAAPNHPLYHYLPAPVRLSERQHVMREQLSDIGDRCHELILGIYYHHLDPAQIAEASDLASAADVEEETYKCNYMVESRLESSGMFPEESFLSRADNELIDRALRQDLTEEDRWDMEAKMDDIHFRAAYERRREWLEAVRVAGRQHLHRLFQQAETLHETDSTVAVTVSERSNQWVWIVVLLLAVGGYFGWQWWQDRQTADPLFYSYFQAYPAVIEDSAVASDSTWLERVFAPYARGSWQLAYDRMDEAVATYPELQLYMSVCALALDRPQDAQERLLVIPPDSRLFQPAQWYLALAYLKVDNRPATRQQLLVIADSDGHPFQHEARMLLEQL